MDHRMFLKSEKMEAPSKKSRSRSRSRVKKDSRDFDEVYQIVTECWMEKQKQLLLFKIPSQEEKDKMENEQLKKLNRLKEIFRVINTKEFPLPVIWKNDPFGQYEETYLIKLKSYLESDELLKPFIKGTSEEFRAWKEYIIKNLEIIAGFDEDIVRLDKISTKILHSYIPERSDARKHLDIVMNKAKNDPKYLKNDVKFSEIMEDVYQRMKENEDKIDYEPFLNKPMWEKKTNLSKFINKYEAYLKQRFKILNVASYLEYDSDLERCIIKEFCNCLPNYIRNKVINEINEDISWKDFLILCIEAERE
uniref:Uncharacterized protein n=1 Tax=Parastrongyloides trichosuri TaxID=131310 RepID=A0A0N4ZKD6_PARTI